MSRFRIELIGACLAIAIGALILMAIAFLSPVLEVFSGDSGDQPVIHAGWTGAIYGAAIIVCGAVAFKSAKWGGVGLVLCAVIGYAFGSRNPTIPLIVLAAASLCFIGWHRAPRPQSRTSTPA